MTVAAMSATMPIAFLTEKRISSSSTRILSPQTGRTRDGRRGRTTSSVSDPIRRVRRVSLQPFTRGVRLSYLVPCEVARHIECEAHHGGDVSRREPGREQNGAQSREVPVAERRALPR